MVFNRSFTFKNNNIRFNIKCKYLQQSFNYMHILLLKKMNITSLSFLEETHTSGQGYSQLLDVSSIFDCQYFFIFSLKASFLQNFLYLIQLLFLIGQAKDLTQSTRASKRAFQVYGCVVTCKDMVVHKDCTKLFDKVCKLIYFFMC